MTLPQPFGASDAIHHRPGSSVAVTRALPEEMAIAMVYDGTTHAVMMATPADVDDFAVGFSLTEGIVDGIHQIASCDVIPHSKGIEAQMWLADDRGEALAARRRTLAGPVGCGLCGIDSIEAAVRSLPSLAATGPTLTAQEITGATESLRGWQPLHDRTRAVHAAGFMLPDQGVVLAREDVGRHNALDKLIGAMARQGIDPAQGAIVEMHFDEDGLYPIVTHAFNFVGRGALGGELGQGVDPSVANWTGVLSGLLLPFFMLPVGLALRQA